MPGRHNDRQTFDQATRISLLEHDVDLIEVMLVAIKAGQEWQTKLLVGVVISLSTGAILMALNLILLRAGH